MPAAAPAVASAASRILLLAALTLLALPRPAAAWYVHSESYVGKDFFTKWSFFNTLDPSKGHVEYVDYPGAVASKLVGASDDEVFMSADMHSIVDTQKSRRSLRLQSVKTYGQGLFVIKVKHVPTGCGVWPAFWMYGEDSANAWPKWGEFDIIEGVHKATVVRTALHTNAGCDQSGVKPGRDFSTSWTKGATKNADSCDVKAPGQFKNQGCSQEGPAGSFGAELNLKGGGTWAAEWDPGAGGRIRTWFWPDGSEPPDLVRREPEISSWGKPYSYFTLKAPACSPTHFQQMRLVFTLNLCGDLAEVHYNESCPEFAKRMSCQELIQKHPETLKNAFWQVRTLDVYQPQLPPGGGPDATAASPRPTTPAPPAPPGKPAAVPPPAKPPAAAQPGVPAGLLFKPPAAPPSAKPGAAAALPVVAAAPAKPATPPAAAPGKPLWPPPTKPPASEPPVGPPPPITKPRVVFMQASDATAPSLAPPPPPPPTAAAPRLGAAAAAAPGLLGGVAALFAVSRAAARARGSGGGGGGWQTPVRPFERLLPCPSGDGPASAPAAGAAAAAEE